MTKEWKFRFTVPSIPDGKPITPNEAEGVLLKQLQTGVRNPEDVMWDLARLYSLTGHQDVALQCVQQLVEATEDPEKKAACYLAMGQLMEQVNDYEAAIKFYSEAMVLEPVNSQTWYFINNNLGYCLNHFGRNVEAERYCQTAIQIDPLRHNGYKNLGISLEGQDLYALAARCYVAAVQTNASDFRALRHLEHLLTKHPEVALEIDDIQFYLEACRAAVQLPKQTAEQLRGNQP
jgi:Flp pilus assembly protein TadD